MKRDQQILEAACRLFVARGYSMVSIDEIGAAAGVSGPAIYRHFGAKSAILATLCHASIDRLIAFVGPKRVDPVEELEALLAGQARLSIKHPELVRIYESDERSLPKTLQADVRRRQREHAKRWVETLSALHPRASAAELEIAAFAAIGLLLGASRWPRSVRAHPALHDRLVEAARNSMGRYGVTAVKPAARKAILEDG
jgi:AcrR family transcriptional regulator